MKSNLTFALGSGRVVEISLAPVDGGRLAIGEVFEVIRHCGLAAHDLDGAVELLAGERALRRALRATIISRPGSSVAVATLVPALRRRLPTITPRQIERMLPRVMTVEYGVTASHDVRGIRGARRGYRGIGLRRTAK